MVFIGKFNLLILQLHHLNLECHFLANIGLAWEELTDSSLQAHKLPQTLTVAQFQTVKVCVASSKSFAEVQWLMVENMTKSVSTNKMK